jgi:hypothetical protein
VHIFAAFSADAKGAACQLSARWAVLCQQEFGARALLQAILIEGVTRFVTRDARCNSVMQAALAHSKSAGGDGGYLV